MPAGTGVPLYEDFHDSASVLVGRFRNDVALFGLPHKTLFAWLHRFYTVLDGLATQHKVYKLYGGAQGFLLATNVAEPDAEHAATLLAFAQRLMRVAQHIRVPGQAPLELSLALDSGPLASGLLGKTSLTYQLVGRPYHATQELADGRYGTPLIVADGMRRSLPAADAAGLLPLGSVQLQCCPDEAFLIYTLPMRVPPPRYDAAPATPISAAPQPALPGPAPGGPHGISAAAGPANPAGPSSSCCTRSCGNMHTDALPTTAAELREASVV